MRLTRACCESPALLVSGFCSHFPGVPPDSYRIREPFPTITPTWAKLGSLRFASGHNQVLTLRLTDYAVSATQIARPGAQVQSGNCTNRESSLVMIATRASYSSRLPEILTSPRTPYPDELFPLRSLCRHELLPRDDDPTSSHS